MLYLKNLSSVEVFNDVKPWDFTDFERVPPECLKDKAARDAWINRPETNFHVYSLYEGTQGNLRLHSGTKDTENPPLKCYGFAIDYDCPTTLENVQAAMKLMGTRLPNYFEETLSGNGRLIWLLEEPINFPSRKFALAVLEQLLDLIPYDKMPGVDMQALKAPERYFTNGCRWHKLSDAPVPADEVRGFVMKVAKKFNWCTSDLGKLAVSMEKLGEELAKKYPRFSEWPGSFSLGAQGPTFWVTGSTSPKSAIVRETGMHTFSAHAHKPFFPWAELVGAEFVERTEDDLFGKAVKDIYFDGRSYLFETPDNNIRPVSTEVIRRYLREMRGLSHKAATGESSPVERALAFIESHQHIDGAASCAFYPKGLFTHNGKRILNTHQIEAMKPAAEASVWGAAGKFPFVSAFLDQFFDPKEIQLERFLAWFQHFYRSCLHRQPISGHALVIAGPVNVGKTFLNRGIIGRAVGGCAEAAAYLSGQDTFNGELFDFALWCVDDGSVTASRTMRQIYTESIKRAVANRDHRCNHKFMKAVLVPWQGRIIITCNDDPVSIGQIPNLDGSSREKVMLFRAGTRVITFSSQPEMEVLLARELPYFLRWLLDWQPPAHCLEGADVRFGVNAYHHPSLYRTSNLSSEVSGAGELLAAWLKDYFTNQQQDATSWVGTATELRMAMSLNVAFVEALRTLRLESFPRILLQLREKGMFKIDVTEDDNGRMFEIHREERFTRPSYTIAPQNPDSYFKK